MSRPTIWVACTDKNTALAYRERLGDICRAEGVTLRFGTGKRMTFSGSDELFETLTDIVSEPDLLDVLLIVDVGADLRETFATHFTMPRRSSWHTRHSRLGMGLELVLRFPQIFPVFAFDATEWRDVMDDSQAPAGDVLPHEHMPERLPGIELHFAESGDVENAVAAFASGMRCLYDCTGLRTLLRNRLIGDAFGTATDWTNTVDARRVLADRLQRPTVVVDEERDVSALCAYAMYKAGERVWVVNTFAQFTRARYWASGNLLVLRDLDLRFPDIPTDLHQGPIRERLRSITAPEWAEVYTNKSATVRAVSRSEDVEEHLRHMVHWSPEELRLGEKTVDGGRLYYGLRKPFPSFGAIAALAACRSEIDARSLVELLVPPGSSVIAGAADTHAAPYVNLTIAESLIARARECSHGEDMRTLILGAVLALDAYTLLLGMSATAAVEALRQFQVAEARIEARFMGLTTEIDIKDRRRELEAAVANLGFGPTGRVLLTRIWGELRVIYREAEQFDAAEQTNTEILVNRQWTRFVRTSHHPLADVRRIDFKRWLVRVVSSFPYLAVFVVGWTLILTALHAAALDYRIEITRSATREFLHLWFCVAISVFQEGGFHLRCCGEFEESSHAVLLLGSVSAFVLLGLFLAVLFRKITRG